MKEITWKRNYLPVNVNIWKQYWVIESISLMCKVMDEDEAV